MTSTLLRARPGLRSAGPTLLPMLMTATIVSTAWVRAQVAIEGDDGPLVSPPGLVSVGAASAPNGQVLVKPAGFSLFYPPPATGPIDFSEAALLGGVPSLDIDAISVGLDWIVTDANGVIVPPGPASWSWAAMLFSPAQSLVATLGVHLRIASEQTRQDGIGGDLFALLVRGSVVPGFTGSTSGRVDLIADSPEISLYQGSVPQLDAYDLMASLYFTGVPGLPWPPVVYFSVTAASVPSLPPAWGTASGATIFRTFWTGNGWSPPVEDRSPASLGLSPANDIDALSVDLFHHSQTYYVFSLAPSVGPGALQATAGTGLSFSRTGLVGRTVFRNTNLTPVEDDIGRGVNPKAICITDPSRDPLLQSIMGLPIVPPFLPWNTGTARAVAWIDHDPQSGSDRFQTIMLSDPCTVFGTTHDAVAILDFPAIQVVLGPVPIPNFLRRSGIGSQLWRGCPATVTALLPPGISGSGLTAHCYWADFDPAASFWTPLPVEFRF